MNRRNEIWLIRHGETEWSRTGRHTGRSDIPLTAVGIQHAARLKQMLATQLFAQVLTSPLIRAKETCTLAGFAAAEIEADLAEWDYGVFEGRTGAQIRESAPGWSIWDTDVPGGESIQQVAARAKKVLARTAIVAGDVALFSHGHMLRILTACWLGLEPPDARLFALDTGAVCVLGYERDQRVIRSWNHAT